MTNQQAQVIPFVLMHATGNRFVLVDALEGQEQDWSALARETADPHFAIGHDGLLVLAPGEQTPFRQRMFNPDGSEDMCGNGLRCTAKHLLDTRRIGMEPVEIETISGNRTVQILEVKPPAAVVRATLAPPALEPVNIHIAHDDVPPPLLKALERAIFVQIGTPHLVVFADWEPLGNRWAQVSRMLETHPDLPDRVTVTWVRAEAPNRLASRFWERSVGETLSCGTGACAAVIAAQREGMAGKGVVVSTAGGELVVSWDGRDTVELTGPAVTICRGTWKAHPALDCGKPAPPVRLQEEA